MNKELDEALCRDFPEIFKDRHSSMKTTAMCWGFDCGDGWEPVIRFGCDQIMIKVKGLRQSVKTIQENLGKHSWATQENLDKKTTELEQELMYIPVASQIKEKFGGLRFYVTGANQRVWDILDTIEHLSYHVCEECGTMKNVRTYTCGWHKTLCNEHADATYGQSEAESFRNNEEEYDI